MTEAAKPLSSQRKMVPESDFMAQKKAREKIEKELEQANSRVVRLEKRLEVVDLSDVSDEDVKNVKQMLLDREAELDEKENKLDVRQTDIDKLEASHKEREKEASIQSFASRWAPKGDDKKTEYQAFVDAIKDAEDPEKEALRLYAERLNSEKEEKPSPEDVFETTPAGGKVKKSPLDMDEKELAEFRKAHIKV